jgi:predicted CoA-binding protein
MKESDQIYELLSRAKTIAVVGLSESPLRPSHGVSAYMQAAGYRIIPVNPQIAEALGEKSYPSLIEMPPDVAEEIDLVDVFRRSEYVDEIVEQAIQWNICGDGPLHLERARRAIRVAPRITRSRSNPLSFLAAPP